MVLGQYEKDRLEPLPQSADLGRTSKAYVPPQERQYAQQLSSSMQEGMVPHNPQLMEILNRIETTLQRQVGAGQLSPEGQKVAQDLQGVVGATREAIEEKNQDELLQKIVYTTGRATQALSTDPTAQQRARLGKQQAPTRQKLLEGMNNLARQFSMSPEFRNVLNDLNKLVRDLFLGEEDIQQQQQQQWGQQQQPMQQQQWDQPGGVGQLGQQVGQLQLGGQQYPVGIGMQQQQPSSVGVSDSGLFGTVGSVIGRSTAGDRPSQWGQGQQQSGMYGQQQPSQFGQQQYGQQQPSQFGQQQYGQQQPSTFRQGSQQQFQGERPGESWQPPPGLDVQDTGASSKTTAQKGKAVSQEGSRMTNKARQLLKSEMSPQKKDRIVQDWISIVRRITADEGMAHAFDTLMNLSYEIKDSAMKAGAAASELPPSKAEIEAESFLIATRFHLRRLIENMAGGRSLDFLRMAIMDFQYKTANDEVFNRYIAALRAFLHKSISDSSYVNSNEYPETCHIMLDGAQMIVRRHEDATERLLFEVDQLDEAIRNDEVTRKLSAASTTLTQDLFLNEQGRWTFKPELINDLRQILIPIIAEQLRYIAVPKISGSDADMDFEVDNIIFRAKDVFPTSIHLENRAMMDVSATDTRAPSLWDSALLIRITDIVAELRDVKFAYRRKKFPKLHDRGELDVILGGKGIGVDAELLASRNDPYHIFRVGDVNCSCSKIDIENMVGEEHKMMYTLLKPIIESRVRRNIVMSIEDTVRKVLTMADERLFAMRRSSGGVGQPGSGGQPSSFGQSGMGSSQKNLGSSSYMGHSSSSMTSAPMAGSVGSRTGSGSATDPVTYAVPAEPGRSVGNTGILESVESTGRRVYEDTGVGGPTTSSGGGPTAPSAYTSSARY